MVGNLYFAFCALVCLLGALGCVTSKKPIRGAIGLLATILGMAGLFLKLDAQFLAAIQVVVYAGAVVVLFVFVIMVLGADVRTDVGAGKAQISRAFAGGLFALISAGALLLLAKGGPTPTRLLPAPPGHGDVEAVGGQLFTEAIVPFELTTALLIAAAIGALAIARGRAVRAPKPHGLPAGEYYHGPVGPQDPAPSHASQSKKGVGA